MRRPSELVIVVARATSNLRFGWSRWRCGGVVCGLGRRYRLAYWCRLRQSINLEVLVRGVLERLAECGWLVHKARQITTWAHLEHIRLRSDVGPGFSRWSARCPANTDRNRAALAVVVRRASRVADPR